MSAEMLTFLIIGGEGKLGPRAKIRERSSFTSVGFFGRGRSLSQNADTSDAGK